MPLISQLIMQICMLTASPTCVREMHVCMRDTFEVNFWDEFTTEEELRLPYQLQYCEIERELAE